MPQAAPMLAMMAAKGVAGGANAYGAAGQPPQQSQTMGQANPMGQESPIAMMMKLLQQRQQNQITKPLQGPTMSGATLDNAAGYGM